MQSRSFAKLFSSITDSSMWDEPDGVVKIWITMLAMADRDGYVGASIPGLAARARKTIAEVEDALRRFMAPDPYSRTKANGGRRVKEAEGGWTLLNYVSHRDAVSAESVRESKRASAARARASRKVETTVYESNDDSIVDTSRHQPSVSASASGVDLDPDQAREDEVTPPPASQVRPGLRTGQPLVHFTLEGWTMSDDLRAEAIVAGVPAEAIDRFVKGLRNGPIGGARGVIDRDDYVRNQFGRWKTWAETERFKRKPTRGHPDTPNQPNCGLTGLEIFDEQRRAAT